MAVDVPLAMIQRGMVADEQVTVGEVGVVETVELATQLEVFIINRCLNATRLLVLETVEGAHSIVPGKRVLIGRQELHVQQRATRGLETV